MERRPAPYGKSILLASSNISAKSTMFAMAEVSLLEESEKEKGPTREDCIRDCCYGLSSLSAFKCKGGGAAVIELILDSFSLSPASWPAR